MRIFIDMNRDRKIICILSFLLIVVFGGYQTNLTFNNIEISKLKNEIQQLKSDTDNGNSKVYNTSANSNNLESQSTNDEIINLKKVDDENIIIDNIKKRFIDSGKEFNKEFNQSLQGKEVVKFEAIDLTTITDSQIKKNIERLNSNNFNMKIEKNKLGDGYFYKIILIE